MNEAAYPSVATDPVQDTFDLFGFDPPPLSLTVYPDAPASGQIALKSNLPASEPAFLAAALGQPPPESEARGM